MALNTIHNFIYLVNFDYILLDDKIKNIYKKSVSNNIHVIPLRQEAAMRREPPNRSDGIGVTLENGFFKILLDRSYPFA